MQDDDVASIVALAKAAREVLGHHRIQELRHSTAWVWLQGVMIASAYVGVIPAHEVEKLKARKDVDRLVAGGYWRAVPGGFKPVRLARVCPTAVVTVPARQPVTDVALVFDTTGPHRHWDLTTQQVATWAALYETLDVLAQCKYAKAWVDANPTRKKTAPGMPRFLQTWLTRAADRPQPRDAKTFTGRGRTGAASQDKYAHLVDGE